MPLSNDEFRQKLQLLGLDEDQTPASQEQVSSIEDPAMQDAPAGTPQMPGIGYQGNPGQEKSSVVAASPEDQAAAQAALAPSAPPKMGPASFQPSAQMASADNDSGPDPRATDENGTPVGTKTPAGVAKTPGDQQAKDAISNVVQNPAVAEYIRKNYGSGADLNDVAMAEAQEIGNKKRLIGGLGGAFDRLISGTTQTKGNPEFFNQIIKDADQPVKDIQDRRKALTDEAKLKSDQLSADEKTDDNDPNGPAAQAVRKLYGGVLKGFGMDEKILDNASPRVIKTYMDQVIRAKDASEARKLIAEQNRMLRETADKGKSEEKAFKNLDDTTNPFKARAGLLADAQKNRQSIERLQGLIERDENGHFNLTKPESEEFSLGLARALAGASPTSRAQIEAIVPHTGAGITADLKSWLLNKPEGREQQDFIKNMYKTILTEKSVAEQQVKRGQLENFAAQDDLYDINPEKFEKKLNARGLTLEEYQKFLSERQQGKGLDLDFGKARESVKTDHLLNPPAKTPGSPAAKPPVAPSAPALKPMAGQDDLVSVVSPEGKPGKIPRANLEKALARGFKEVN